MLLKYDWLRKDKGKEISGSVPGSPLVKLKKQQQIYSFFPCMGSAAERYILLGS